MKLLNVLRKHRYELIAFLTGAVVMMLEIVGARLIAPYLGTSTYVWTAMIGVILGAMSLGFWVGGKMADNDRPSQDLGVLLAFAALMVLLMVVVQQPVLNKIANQGIDLRISAVQAAVVLFGVPSFLIGTVSPHLAKIRVTSLKTTGATIGKLEAASALGSIAGTFLSGYVLLAYFGARNLSLWLVIILVLTSFLAGWRKLLALRILIVLVSLVGLQASPKLAKVIYDTDTAYSRYRIYETVNQEGRVVRSLIVNRSGIQSAIYPDSPLEPVVPYVAHMMKAAESYPYPERILLLGGGAHHMPAMLQAKSPTTQIDVVEIDPKLYDISVEYFSFSKAQNTNLYYEDGRTFLNTHTGGYDLILVDAFSELTPPFHITSLEAIHRLRLNLSQDGIVVVNIPSTINGFLPSIYKSYAEAFSSVEVFASNPKASTTSYQNFTLIAGQDSTAFTEVSRELGTPVDVPKNGMILTDNYSPVERLSY